MRDSRRPLWQLAAYMAVIVLLGTTIALLKPQPVLSDSDLTAAVNAAFLPRTEDPALHELAHQRALEASVNFSHTGATTAEVLAYNSGFSDPIATVISQWIGSPAHAALLSDPSFTSIGCGAVTTPDGRYVAACLLAQEKKEPPPPDQPPPTTVGGVPIADGSVSPATDGGRGTDSSTPLLPNTALKLVKATGETLHPMRGR